MPQDRTRKIVITGVLGAISAFLGLTPLGFIVWGSVSLTLMHIPVIIGAVLEGPIVGLVIGLIFGLASMLRAAVAPNSPADLLFLNPLIAVLPRLFIGPVAWLVFRALRQWPVAGWIGAGIAGALTNTTLVLGMIGVLGTLGAIDIVSLMGEAFWPVIGGVFVANGLPEAAVSAVLVTAVLAAWTGIRVGRRQGSRV
jgi:uncharacterized membrane protein